jgi:lysozyme family protein
MPTRAAIVIPGFSGTVLREDPTSNAYPEEPFYPPSIDVNPNGGGAGTGIFWPPPTPAPFFAKKAATLRLAAKNVAPVCPIWSYHPTLIPGLFSIPFVGGVLVDTLADIVRESGADPKHHMLGFGYDFRLDLRIAAEKLALFIEKYCASVDEVLIVAHSTGGRVARYALECMDHSKHKSLKKIKHMVFLAVPHLGTATSLSFAIGADDSFIADGKTVAEITAADDRLCGLYQLFPHDGKSCAFDKTANGEPAINIYTKAGAKKLGLNWKGVEKAIAFRDALNAGQKPNGVRYSSFYGDGTDTVVSVKRDNGMWSLIKDPNGDGTVSKASATAALKGDPPQFIEGVDHTTLPTKREMLNILRDIYKLQPIPWSLFDLPATPLMASLGAGIVPIAQASGAERFAICLPLILEHEGGYVDHPQDPVGATNLGITIGTLSRWLGREATKAQVRALTPTSVAPIYRAYYWLPVKGDAMPAGVDYAVFDYAVNSGVGRAVRHLQDILGVTVDGAIGAETMAEIGRQNPDFVIRALCERRLDYLKSLPTWPTFGRGWERRVQRVEDHALEMATGVPHGAQSLNTSAPAPRGRRQTRPTPPPGP